MRVIRLADSLPAPWKNGAGATRELWRHADADGMVARISVAEITGDQPFSVFPGVDRVILQLDGPTMVLHIDGQDHGIAAPRAFPGEARVACKMSGPGIAHDLNLMVRRGACQPHMRLVTAVAGQPLDIGDGQGFAAVFALGPCRLTGPEDIDLGRHDLLLITEPTALVPRQACSLVHLTMTAPARSGAMR